MNAQIAGRVKSHPKKEETFRKMTKFEMLIQNEDHILGCIKDWHWNMAETEQIKYCVIKWM